MLLKSIKLHNIRSYLKEEIEFPEGSVLLSGDIGSGKSTILLAVEFALFGIMKGDLPGDALLRHGKRDGYVELKLELNRKEVVIKRTLKKSAAGVKQDSGYVIAGGKKREGTATELKAAVLDMLGYPKELISRSKGLVYRYTVYTPQEAMKQILFEDREQRLDTLRRVFNIDKYKRIRENALIYIRELREQRKETEGYVSDFDEKQRHAGEKENEIKNIGLKIAEIEPKLRQGKIAAEESKKKEESIRKGIEELQKLKKEMALCELDIKHRARQNSSNSAQIKDLQKQASAMEKEIGEKPGFTLEEIKRIIEEKEKAVNFLNDTLLRIARKTSEFEAAVRSSEEIKQKVARLDSCPMCMQEVSREHKSEIVRKEDEKTRDARESAKAYAEQEKKSQAELRKAKKGIDELRISERQAELMRERARSLEDKKRLILEIEKQQQEIKREIGAANAKKMKLAEEISSRMVSESEYEKAKAEHEKALGLFHKAEIEYSSFLKEKEGVQRLLDEIRAELEKKSEAKERLKRAKEVQHWLEEFFISLAASIEKQVMANVFHQFNSIFHDWFKMLIEDETISSRLDDTFTPVVVQNGFETGIEHLSGGEKTSCALAYRLALNKVINEMITGIKTKDLIILDEPTDGFSSEQLDKVRDVLEELNMRQVIIVSHEPKIESFVDSVIRIQKSEHISQVQI